MTEEVRTDFLSQEIKVGDTVIYGTTTNTGRGLNIGVITRFTPKMVKIKSRSYWEDACYAEQLCKVSNEYATFKLLKG